MIPAPIFAIACGYEDCKDFETLRCDPAFKLARGRRPDLDAFPAGATSVKGTDQEQI